MEGGGRSHGYKKGLWTAEEDRILTEYIRAHGKGKWNRVTKVTGLNRCGKSCRLRWMNYLSPTVKRDDFSEEENDLIIRLHKLLGNRWSLIAGRVPGRTDNQVKNHWNSLLSKKLGAIRNYRLTTEKSKAKNSGGSSSRIQSTTATSSSDQEASLEKDRESNSVELQQQQQQQPQSKNGGDDDNYEASASLVGAGGRGSDDGGGGGGIWESTMMMGCNNSYDQSSCWFYNNNNEDGLNLYYCNYFMDGISQDHHHHHFLLHDYPLGLLEDIGF